MVALAQTPHNLYNFNIHNLCYGNPASLPLHEPWVGSVAGSRSKTIYMQVYEEKQLCN